MKSFKKFLLEEISDNILKNTIDRLYQITDIETISYYVKAGSPIFALALYELINKKGELYAISDKDTDNLHNVVKVDEEYWDINGGGTLEDKEEYLNIIGNKNWKITNDTELLKKVESPEKIVELYKKLKNIYLDEQNKK